MALSKIVITKGSGGLGRRLAGSDHVSGLAYYHATALVGDFIDFKKQVFSLKQAENLGITEADFPVLHYHIGEFFRINERGSLWVGMFDTPELTHDFTEVTTLQDEASGEIRQIGVYTQKEYSEAMDTALQAVLSSNESNHKPLSAILTADISALDLSTLPDRSSVMAPKVSVIIGQDGAGVGAGLFASQGKTIGALGACLGAISLASVHESISWVGKFNVGGSELDDLAFGEGTPAGHKAPVALMEELDGKKYIFLQKHAGIAGSYFSGSWTGDNGDFETIELNRTIDKAIRNVRSVLLPFLSAPVYVDRNAGTLSEDTIQAFTAEGNRSLDPLLTAGELSGGRVLIDPAQDVLSSSEIAISIDLVPVGVARTIRVTIGFTTKLN